MAPAIPYIVYAIMIALSVSSYMQAQKAKKAAQRAAGRSSTQGDRGLLYQTRASALPRRILYGRKRMGAIECYIGSSGDSNEYLHFIFIWCDGPCVGIEKLFFDDEQVPFDSDGNGGGKYAGHLKLMNRNGTLDQTAIAEAVAEMPGWATSDKLTGVCASWLRVKKNDAIFPNGMPNVSAVIQGRNDVWNFRTETYGYSENPAECLCHYLTLKRMGPGVDRDIDIGEIEVIAASNVCDEAVAISTGGTEKRYTFNGVIQLDQEPESIVETFRTAMAGTIVRSGGRWKIYAGAYITPTLELTEDMIVGEVTINTKTSRSDAFNTVKGVFSSELYKWQPTDFIAFVIEDAFIVPTGETPPDELPDDIELLNTNSPTMCRRIAKIDAMRQYKKRTFSAPFNIEALQVQPGVPVMLTFPKYGFNQTPMDALGFQMSISEKGCVIQLMLRETSPSDYSWDPSEDKAAEIVIGTTPITQLPGQVSPVIASPGSEIDFNTTSEFTHDWHIALSCATIGALIEYKVVDYLGEEGVSAWTTYTGTPILLTIEADSGKSIWVRATKSALIESAHSRFDYFLYPMTEIP